MCWSLLVELKHIFQGVVRNVIQQGLINKDTKVTLLKIFIDHNFINNFQKIIFMYGATLIIQYQFTIHWNPPQF